mgnify:CR=1 FL=1
MSKPRLNERLIELLDTLSAIQMRQGEPFRAKAYQKAKETLLSYQTTAIPNTDITNTSQLKGIPNFGASIIEKCTEYIATGTLDMIEKDKIDRETNPVYLFSNIYGIGPKKAADLVAAGFTSIAQLRQAVAANSTPKLLTKAQIAGLEHYEDIMERIPRDEIDTYNRLFYDELITLFGHPGVFQYSIVGSYRRGARDSGDIDVILSSPPSTNPSNISEQTIYEKLVDSLIKKGIITDVLSRGKNKCLVIATLPSSQSQTQKPKYRRVDFLCATPTEYPFSLLYFTGSMLFNTALRNHVLSLGMTMNEHGITYLTTTTKTTTPTTTEKKGTQIEHIFKTERDIFDFLRVVYKEPEERKDGRDVVLLT